MKEILLAILIPQIILIPFYYALHKIKKKGGAEDGGGGELPDVGRVSSIIRGCYIDLKRQRASGFGPWLSTFLEGDCLFISGYGYRGKPIVEVAREGVDPLVALTAVRWTIRDLSGSRFNLDALRRAEEELMGMCA